MSATRREFLSIGAAGAAALALPGLSRAAGKIVATTYPGSFEEAYRAVLLPAFQKATGASATLAPLLGVDQVAKITAARSNPPFDVVMFDEGPLLNAIKADVLQRFPADKAKNARDLPAAFQGHDGWGPTVTLQIIGMAYNPKRVKTPPTSWEDLWKPEYKGRVGLTGMGSSLGTAFMVEIAKMHGGSETNIEPAFAAMKQLLPSIGALAPSPGALAALFQQGQIDIAPNYFNNIELLRGKGVDVAFAVPKSGGVLVRTSMQIVANSAEPELALRYIDTLLSPEVQTALEAAPWVMTPTNAKVKLTGEQARLAKDVNELQQKMVLHDWAKIQAERPAWIERFNKEVKL
jgi:putative spermidine/putrescine transport system substrate-binding protein